MSEVCIDARMVLGPVQVAFDHEVQVYGILSRNLIISSDDMALLVLVMNLFMGKCSRWA